MTVAGEREALDRIAGALRSAGANLPAPENKGTIESALLTGLSIALAIVEAERDDALLEPVGEGWQPIETAPKDGRTIVLGFMENGEVTQTAEMQWSHIQRNGLFPGAVGMWVCPGGNFTWKPEPKEFGPTHWRAVAASPKSNGGMGS